MKILSKIAVFISLVLMVYGCPEYGKIRPDIKVINKSDYNIVLQEQINPKENKYYCSNVGTTIWIWVKSNDSTLLVSDETYNNNLNKSDSVIIYIIDENTYKKYWKQPCDTFFKYVPVLHRYQLNIEDLQSMNWTVVYPPE